MRRLSGSGSKGKKTEEKKFTPKPQILTNEKREIIKISWFLNGLSSFRIKISEKNKTNLWKFCFVKKISKFIEMTWIQIHFFPMWIRIKIKWIQSTASLTSISYYPSFPNLLSFQPNPYIFLFLKNILLSFIIC